jgi:hypothetical protein
VYLFVCQLAHTSPLADPASRDLDYLKRVVSPGATDLRARVARPGGERLRGGCTLPGGYFAEKGFTLTSLTAHRQYM